MPYYALPIFLLRNKLDLNVSKSVTVSSISFVAPVKLPWLSASIIPLSFFLVIDALLRPADKKKSIHHLLLVRFSTIKILHFNRQFKTYFQAINVSLKLMKKLLLVSALKLRYDRTSNVRCRILS
ncbi:hypothetical protein B6N58_07570 [Legionella micdadei]|nr:hypothetical protein B6N58_07570 [Legionella micdadei]